MVPTLYNPGDGSTIPVIDSSITLPQVTSTGDGVNTFPIRVTTRTFDTVRLVLSIGFSITQPYSAGTVVQFSVSNFANPVDYNTMTGFQITTYDLESGGSSIPIDVTSIPASL